MRDNARSWDLESFDKIDRCIIFVLNILTAWGKYMYTRNFLNAIFPKI